MEITTKELRLQPGRIIEQAANGIEITVTFRGKPIVKIVPIKENLNNSEDNDIFGLWEKHEDIDNVEEHIRNLRKGRQF